MGCADDQPEARVLADAGAALAGGYAVCGALSKTAVAIESGGRTQVGNLFAGLLGILTILFLLPLLQDLADGTLAAIVIVAILGLSDIGYFRRLWQLRRIECVVGIVAFSAVLVLGVLSGVVIGVALALFIIGNLAARMVCPVPTRRTTKPVYSGSVRNGF